MRFIETFKTILKFAMDINIPCNNPRTFVVLKMKQFVPSLLFSGRCVIVLRFQINLLFGRMFKIDEIP